jgi:cytochrome P450/NADPH-cytochrome P450 reductase
VNSRLEALGATAVAKFGFGDVGSPTWEDVQASWQDRVWPELIELAGAQPTEAAAARVAAEKAAEEKLTETDSNTAMELSLDGQIIAPTILTNAVGLTTHTVTAEVCRELQAAESPTKTRHLEVTLPEGFQYTAGDHLGVCPQNDEQAVSRLAARLGAAPDGVFAVPRSMTVRAVPKGVALQVRNVLTCLVDITSKPGVPLIDLLLDKVSEPADRARLEEIKQVLMTPEGADSPLRRALNEGGYSPLVLLEQFPDCELNIFEFLQVAQPLRPRYYSTCSSPRIHGDGVAHVAVGNSPKPVTGMDGRVFQGMSSSYVHRIREGDRMNIFLDRAEGFHLQDDCSRPMIFVSAGTGYAPMRAFLWERLAIQREGNGLGPAVLFNGIRASALDYIYEEEIASFAEEGVLDHLHVAMSREIPGKRVYVQDLLREQGALVWRLVDEGAFIYVCGSQMMRDDVRAALVAVLAEHGGMTQEQADAHLTEMETTEKRYRPDVWS